MRNDSGIMMESQRAFTLLELLLAMSILALLSLGVAAGLSAGIRAWESGEQRLGHYQGKRIVVERLVDEISNAVNLRGKSENDDYARMIFDGESDRLSFVTSGESITSAGIPMGLKELHITVEPGEGLLMRESMFSNTDFFNDSRGASYILDPDVTDIAFRYLYIPSKLTDSEGVPVETEWLDSWGPEQLVIEEVVEETEKGEMFKQQEVKNQLPIAVEVTLTVNKPDGSGSEEWAPILIPLNAARVIGVSTKRR